MCQADTKNKKVPQLTGKRKDRGKEPYWELSIDQADVSINGFDGEGLISREYAELINRQMDSSGENDFNTIPGRPVYYYKGEALFSAHTLSTNNALKAAVNRNWMEDVMPAVIEEAHFLQWLGSKESHKEYFIYRDCGSGRPLLWGRGSENF